MSVMALWCGLQAQLTLLRPWQVIPGTDNYRFNYWGYSTVGFFAPMARYSAAAGAGQPASEVIREFKTLVRECHKRGIEVILDVVFNHTAEGNQNGPSLSFRQAYCHLGALQLGGLLLSQRSAVHCTATGIEGYIYVKQS